MKLTGMMAVLGPFISKLSEKGLPFFKLLKKANKFVWDDETQKAFEPLKESLTTPPIMTPPVPKEILLIYISVTPMWSAQSSSLNERKKGRPILFNDMCIT
jgi:hypothetical protein